MLWLCMSCWFRCLWSSIVLRASNMFATLAYVSDLLLYEPLGVDSSNIQLGLYEKSQGHPISKCNIMIKMTLKKTYLICMWEMCTWANCKSLEVNWADTKHLNVKNVLGDVLEKYIRLWSMHDGKKQCYVAYIEWEGVEVWWFKCRPWSLELL
jgi:hypothetical protein